ncbi:hypothetical protein [Streptomyces sp. F-1]|uniref:hypothetical protein n=1 Tax=Streptomyces sp. F-1 TaxID=463642 RepID=UPI00085BCC52|nr:hypothetical protein [Streptomyces sp. F-1]SFY52038.1 hypothetical protein STEPF1_05307 [Streptomyces sp. F-1]
MAQYVVTGRNSNGEGIVSIQIGAINQDSQVVADLDVVAAVRNLLAGAPGVVGVQAQKFEQVITNV